nr:MAG TPA: hypothetical protein [Caudoviricetes sp.]
MIRDYNKLRSLLQGHVSLPGGRNPPNKLNRLGK